MRVKKATRRQKAGGRARTASMRVKLIELGSDSPGSGRIRRLLLLLHLLCRLLHLHVLLLRCGVEHESAVHVPLQVSRLWSCRL